MSLSPLAPLEGLDPETRAEREAMARAALGDADAFAVIYDRHAPVLLALARRMLGATPDAADLLHDVFLEAWQHVRQYDPSRASVRTWLLVRMRSRALDRRARAARHTSALQVALERSGHERARAEATARASDRVLAIRAALTTLEVDVRHVLELTYFEGLTAVEIAAREGIALGTVKSRLARGLARLQALLSELRGEHP